MIWSKNIPMVQEKVTVSTRPLQWKCVESRADSKSRFYGWFVLAPLMIVWQCVNENMHYFSSCFPKVFFEFDILGFHSSLQETVGIETHNIF